MFDQDTPRPDGDDSPQTDETDQVIFQNNKLMVTETVQFIPPFGDEALGSATTGFEGIAHFVISQLASIAGTVVTTQTTDYLRTGDEKTTSTSTPAFEARPDLYFLMTNDETQVDTRRVSPGLLVNAGAGGRVGTADNPITFTFSPNIVAQP
jgi:hypothetical protein